MLCEIDSLTEKWPSFYAEILVWVRTRERRPIRLPWGVGVVSCANHVV